MTDTMANDGTRDGSADRLGTDAVAGTTAGRELVHTHLRRRARVRALASGLLVLLTVISMVTATVAVWARQTVMDTDRFMAAVGPALDDPAFYDGLGDVITEQALTALALDDRVSATLTQVDTYLADALIEALDPDQRTLTRLSRIERPSLAALAPPITSALEAEIASIVDGFITSDEFTDRFPDLVRELHRGGTALIRDDLAELPNVYIDGGDVRLDLVPVIAQALQRVTMELGDLLPDITIPQVLDDRRDARREQLAVSLGRQLPEDFGQLTIMSGTALSEVQQAATRVDRLVGVLALVAVALVAVTLATSANRRRTVAYLAVGLLAGLALTLAAVRRLQAAIVAEIASPDGGRAAQALLGELFSSLRTLTALTFAAAIGIASIAYLAGRPSRLAAIGASEVTAPGVGPS
jgi:hypothetical protein